MIIPPIYQALDKKGNLVTGYFVMLHMEITDKSGHIVLGYEAKPHLFNDSGGHRDFGGYWHEINIDTLTPINQQLKLFEND